MKGKSILLLVALCIANAGVAFARGPKPLSVPLRYMPQETVSSEQPSVLPPSLSDIPLRLVLVDVRGSDPTAMGEGTDDDDRAFPISSVRPVADFVSDGVRRIAADTGARLDDGAATALTIRLVRLRITEKNQAFGSTYAGDVGLAFSVARAGAVVHEGAVAGEANRYGKSASAENISEVLSDALKQAAVAMLVDQRFQAAWRGAPAPDSEPAGRDTAEARLSKLDALLKKGSISPEEHKAARAKVLELQPR